MAYAQALTGSSDSDRPRLQAQGERVDKIAKIPPGPEPRYYAKTQKPIVSIRHGIGLNLTSTREGPGYWLRRSPLGTFPVGGDSSSCRALSLSLGFDGWDSKQEGSHCNMDIGRHH